MNVSVHLFGFIFVHVTTEINFTQEYVTVAGFLYKSHSLNTQQNLYNDGILV